jgi:hypothetical protein
MSTTAHSSGTEGSNPSPSTDESANLRSLVKVLSMQFVGRNSAEATLLQVARARERAAETDKKHPLIG